MEQDQSFISALATLQRQVEEDDIAALDGWSAEQLKVEVVRLRRALVSVGAMGNLGVVGNVGGAPLGGVGVGVDVDVRSVGVPMGVELSRIGEDNGLLPLDGVQFGAQFMPKPEAGPSRQPQGQQQQQQQIHQPPPGTELPKRRRSSADEGGPSRRKPSRHDVETGKRVERGRRVELQRAIRTKMKSMMGIGLDDDLPAPSGEHEDPGVQGWVPNWPAGTGDERNTEWLDRVCSTFITEATSFNTWDKVPVDDLDPDIVKAAVRTAFHNFAKRYLAEVDPQQAQKQQRYIKNRRRWARKDLKQKRRAKAALDPSFADVPLPHVALHIDYMSSEHSSAGEDEDGNDPLTPQRQAEWMNTLNAVEPDNRSGKRGWADGVSEKVLEVRTPTWRSARLDDMYRQLDNISSAQAALRATPASRQAANKADSNPRLGHVAPSHKRFTLPRRLMRLGHRPRDVGEHWMWATGEAGVWPEREAAEEDAAARVARETREAVAAAVDAVQSEQMGRPLDPTVDALVEGWTEGV